MPVEATVTETAQNPTEAATSTTEAVAPTLLGNEAAGTETTQQPTETAPAETPAEPKPAETDAKPAEGAPEKYEFTAPEGKEYDSNLLTAFEAAAKDSNLTQETAQKLLDKMAPAIAERQTEQVAAIRKDWFEASKSDKEFGGEKLEQNLGIAKKALDTFGSPELNQLLVSTGLGNHPEVIRMMYRAGKAIGEDTFVSGGGSTTPSVKSFYPNSNMK
jgi:hypothetical protein